MISEVLLKANTDPTLSIGGILKTIGGNIRIGHSGYFVTEACEYTNSFLSFFPKIGIILNVEEDHMDFFKDIDDIRSSFHRFAGLIPDDGTLIINNTIDGLGAVTDGLTCRVVTYGPDCTADYWSENITYNEKGCASFTLCTRDGKRRELTLGVPGEHNISNALAVVALSDTLGLDYEAAKEGLAGFTGTDRRYRNFAGCLKLSSQILMVRVPTSHIYPYQSIYEGVCTGTFSRRQHCSG